MKKLLLFLLAILPLSAWGHTIDQATARQKASAFLQQRVDNGMRKAPQKSHSETLVECQTNAPYYAFNVGESEGFILVSASDKTQTILGYADSGRFDMANAPESFRAWLASLSKAITAMENGSDIPQMRQTVGPRKAKSTTKSAISTLVSCQWNQGDPYNLDCPTYDNNGTPATSATGCVATAMAQVMYYWKWPKDPTPEIPGYTTNWNSTTTTYDALPSTTFDWDNMLDTYDSSSPTVAKKAVANLMHYVGKSIYMGYGPSSGAASGNCATALRNYYGYDKNLYHTSHDEYTYTEWEDLIYNELANSRPVLMAGDNSDLTGGHEWVCDGYDGNGLFHMNWGWGGLCDGYFILTVMFPDQQGIGGSTSSDGYSMSQNIIVNLQPAQGSQQDPEETVRIGISNFSATKTSFTRKDTSRNFYVTGLKYRTGTSLSKEYQFDACLTLYNEQGEIIEEELGVKKNFGITPGYWGPDVASSYLFGADLPDGTYYLRGRSRENGTTEWIDDRNAQKSFVKAVISDGVNLDLTLYPTMSLTVNSIELIGNGAVGSEQKVKVNITNTDDIEYYQNTFLLVDGSFVSGNCIVVPGKSTGDYYFKYTPSTAGSHRFAMSTSKSSSDAFYTTDITIKEASSTTVGVTMKSLCSVSNSEIYGNVMRLQTRLTNKGDNDFVGNVEASAWRLDGNVYWKGVSSSQFISLPAGESTTLEFTLEGLSYDETYNFHVDAGSSGSGNMGNYTFRRGFLYWKADGLQQGAAQTGFTITPDMLAVSVPGTTSIPSFSVESNVNPNLIIYFNEGASVSSRVLNILKKSVHNIVFGSEAESIAFTDTCDAHIPYSFTADEVSLTHAAAETDGSALWTTLTLPFSPQTIEADGVAVDWYRSADDSGKQLRIEEFSAIDGPMLYFTPAETVEANHPYALAVKGTHGDEQFDLSGKTLQFCATNQMVEAADVVSTYSSLYKLVGTYASVQVADAYILSSDGSQFVKQAEVAATPFSAYIVANTDQAAEATVLTVDGLTPTAIATVVQSDDAADAVYSISGTKLGTRQSLSSLPKGLYIVGGKKIAR